MPRFFFHLEGRPVRVRDETGLRLPDEEAAWYQAVRSGRDLIRAEEVIGGAWGDQWVEIEDEAGLKVDRIRLADIARYGGGR